MSWGPCSSRQSGRKRSSSSRFNKVVTNRVKAPTKNRHFVVDNGTVTRLVNNAGELDITSGDVVSMGVIDSLTAYLDQLVSPPPPVEFDTDQAAKDSPFRVLLCSPATYNIFSADPNFRTYQANALARARYAKDHPLFANPDNALWRNTLLVKMPNKPIRFYAGDDIKYCGAFDTETEAPARCLRPSPTSSPWTATSCWAARRWPRRMRRAATLAGRTSGRSRPVTLTTSWN